MDFNPEQWPEHWKVVEMNLESFYPDELRYLLIKSKLEFDKSGNIEAIQTTAFGLEVPGAYVPSGFNKEIAWFDLNEFSTTGNKSVDWVIQLIKGHAFHAELMSYDYLIKAD